MLVFATMPVLIEAGLAMIRASRTMGSHRVHFGAMVMRGLRRCRRLHSHMGRAA